ncbi:MAG: polyprenyl synthetase family protein [marine benthic group bacterium]|nr:polyprenyl synthetase family protein [Candidatus Benthicola marisminoris]
MGWQPVEAAGDPGSGKSRSNERLEEMRALLDDALETFLSDELRGLEPDVADAVRYAVLSPGKRIRPLLLMASYEATAGVDPRIAPLALSVELVHAYSLVHDDLPCMDDDVLRRGRPTVHVRFGTPVAVLAGAALMPLAVRAILRGASLLELKAATVDRLVAMLARASGASGMVGGQLLDLRAEGRAISGDDLEEIHSGKTARLIAASTVMGGIAAGASQPTLEALHRFGMDLGLAFQAVDDILDLRGTSGELGKESGRDRALGKATYPALFGLEETEKISRAFANAAIAELELLERPEGLTAIASYVIERTH